MGKSPSGANVTAGADTQNPPYSPLRADDKSVHIRIAQRVVEHNTLGIPSSEVVAKCQLGTHTAGMSLWSTHRQTHWPTVRDAVRDVTAALTTFAP